MFNSAAAAGHKKPAFFTILVKCKRATAALIDLCGGKEVMSIQLEADVDMNEEFLLLETNQ